MRTNALSAALFMLACSGCANELSPHLPADEKTTRTSIDNVASNFGYSLGLLGRRDLYAAESLPTEDGTSLADYLAERQSSDRFVYFRTFAWLDSPKTFPLGNSLSTSLWHGESSANDGARTVGSEATATTPVAANFLHRLGLVSVYGFPPWDLPTDDSSGMPSIPVPDDCKVPGSPDAVMLLKKASQSVFVRRKLRLTDFNARPHHSALRLVGGHHERQLFCNTAINSKHVPRRTESQRLKTLIDWSNRATFHWPRGGIHSPQLPTEHGSLPSSLDCWQSHLAKHAVTTPDPLLSRAFVRLRCMIDKGEEPFRTFEDRRLSFDDVPRVCRRRAKTKRLSSEHPTFNSLCPQTLSQP